MQVLPSPLKDPTSESCHRTAAVLGEESQFAKLKQDGNATHIRYHLECIDHYCQLSLTVNQIQS